MSGRFVGVCRETLSPWRFCEQQKLVSPICAEAVAAFGSAHPADAVHAFTFAGPCFLWPGHALGIKLKPNRETIHQIGRGQGVLSPAH